MLRRTAGTQLARHAVLLTTVAAVMGHSDVRLTARFCVDLPAEDTRRAVEGAPDATASKRQILAHTCVRAYQSAASSPRIHTDPQLKFEIWR